MDVRANKVQCRASECVCYECYVFWYVLIYVGKVQIITQVLGENLSYVRDAENIKHACMGYDWVEYYQR